MYLPLLLCVCVCVAVCAQSFTGGHNKVAFKCLFNSRTYFHVFLQGFVWGWGGDGGSLQHHCMHSLAHETLNLIYEPKKHINLINLHKSTFCKYVSMWVLVVSAQFVSQQRDVNLMRKNTRKRNVRQYHIKSVNVPTFCPSQNEAKSLILLLLEHHRLLVHHAVTVEEMPSRAPVSTAHHP